MLLSQNNLDELWSIFTVACGEELLGDRHRFRRQYGNKISRSLEKGASDLEQEVTKLQAILLITVLVERPQGYCVNVVGCPTTPNPVATQHICG